MLSQELLQQNSEEIWIKIPWNTDYMVSNLGNVKSLDRIKEFQYHNQYGPYILKRKFKGKTLKPRITRNGYLRVQIGNKDYYIHRLVAEVFIGDITDLEINHKDGIKSNNSVSNLEIVTRYANHDHAILTGLNKTSKCTVPVRVNGVEYKSLGSASKQTGISTDTLKCFADGIRSTGYKYTDLVVEYI